MRILFIMTQDLHSPAGIGRYGPLARELAHHGHQIRIIALHPDFGTLTARQFNLDGVDVEYVAPMHVIKRGNQKSYYRPHQLMGVILRATLALSWAALRSPVDIVYVGKPHPMNSIAGLLAKFLRGSTLVVDCDDYETGLGRFSGEWQRRIIEFFEMHIPRWANAVTTHTDFMRSNLISWGVPPEKIVHLQNGIDPQRFAPPCPKCVEAKRARLNLADKKVVAYIGSLSMPSHPVDLLIATFAQLQLRLPDTVLMIVGGGDTLIDLQKQAAKLGIEGMIRFVGRVSPEEIPLYYALADVSTDPIHDNDAARGRSPLKLFESWICGVPFVTADVGDRRKLIGNPPAGVLVSPGSSQSLTKGILEVLTNTEQAKAYIQRGHVRVQKYDWNILAQELETVFLELHS